MRQHWLITYDIADERRLVRVQKLCERFGRAVQFSVYQCELTERALQALQTQMLHRIEVDEDTVTYYPLCEADITQALHLGSDASSHKAAEDSQHWVV